MTTRSDVEHWQREASGGAFDVPVMREAVPAMAAMLERAAAVIADTVAFLDELERLGIVTRDPAPAGENTARSWLREWRGDPAAEEEGANAAHGSPLGDLIHVVTAGIALYVVAAVVVGVLALAFIVGVWRRLNREQVDFDARWNEHRW